MKVVFITSYTTYGDDLRFCPYTLNKQRLAAVKLKRLTPNDPYRGRTAPLTSKAAFYKFIQQIQVLNILTLQRGVTGTAPIQ